MTVMMGDVNTQNDVSKRAYLKYIGTGAAATIAGCLGGGDGDFPNQDIRFIVPYAEGGGTDVYARAVAPTLGNELGVNIRIENIPGASGLQGFSELMSANPDGHTILATASPLEAAPQLLEDPGFDQRNSEGVAIIGQSPSTTIVSSEYEGEVNNFEDMLEMYATGEWSNVASLEQGSHIHITYLLTKHRIEEYSWEWDEVIYYEGTGPITQAVAANEVPCGIGSDTGVASVVESGDAFPINHWVSGGSEVFPNIPAVTDLGYPEIDWVGATVRAIYTTPDTPGENIDVLADAIETAIGSTDVQEWSEQTNNAVMFEGPEAADEYMNEIFTQMEEQNVVDLIRQNT